MTFELALRQSDIATLDRCSWAWAEDQKLGEDRWETTPASLGSACHAAIEGYIAQDIANYDDMVSVMEMDFIARTELPNFRWVKIMTAETALKHGRSMLAHWWEKYAHVMGAHSIAASEQPEVTFKLPFYEDDHHKISLHGTMDVLQEAEFADEDGAWREARVIDWKSSTGGEWRRDKVLEVTKWGIQSTIYTWAATQLCGYTVTDFTYGIIHPHGVQEFTVTRSPSDWDFLVDRVLAYARMIEAGTFVPNPGSHLCSATWCQHWTTCRGRH